VEFNSDMEYIFQQESVSRDAHPLKNVQEKKKILKNPNNFIF
jgi:hypothetical protein